VSVTKPFKLTCYSSKPPKWTFSKRTLPKPHSISGSDFIVKFATIKHKGEYQCHGILPNGSEFMSKASVYVARKEVANL